MFFFNPFTRKRLLIKYVSYVDGFFYEIRKVFLGVYRHLNSYEDIYYFSLCKKASFNTVTCK